MTTYLYQPVKTTRRRSAPCPVCGRRVTRSRTFEHTINPFHPAVRDCPPDTTPARAVRQAVEAEADAWQPDFRHDKCVQ